MGAQYEMAECEKKMKSVMDKESVNEKFRKSQDTVIENLKSRVHDLEEQLTKTNADKEDLEVKGLYHGTADLENKEVIEAKEAEIVKAQVTIDKLQSRCDEIAEQVKSEKKMRMECEREVGAGTSGVATTGKKSKKGDAKTPLQDTERIKLEQCLSLLRCSVCLTNFKECALTRCMHLFCNDCIQTNIAQRLRKCPMCGDKFTENEVKKVYFR